MKNTFCCRNKFFSVSMIIILMFFINACTPGNGPTPQGSSNVDFSGTSACPDVSGVVKLSFDTSTDSTVTGTVTFNGTTYNLTGTYVAATATITASSTGSDVQYALSGTYTSGSGVSGVITVTDSGVITECSVAAQVDDTANPVQNYLGTFGEDTSNSELGTWNMSIKNGIAVGTYYKTKGVKVVSGTFTGTVSDSTLLVDAFYYYYLPTQTYYLFSDHGVTGTATGTFSGNTVSGSWKLKGILDINHMHIDDNGLFTGTLQ